MKVNFRYAALSGIVLITIIAYTAYWFSLAEEIVYGIAKWAEARRGEGMVVEYSALEVTGFPLRVQPQAANVRISGPGADPAWEWRSARLVGNVLPYSLNRIVLSAPEPQDIRLRINGGKPENYMLKPDSAFASLTLKKGRLVRADLDIKGGMVNGGRLQAGPLNIRRAQLHWRMGENGAPQGLQNPVMFDLSAKLENMDYPGFAGSALGSHLTLIAMTAAIEGAWPSGTGIPAIREWRDAGGVAQLKAAEIDWGPLKLKMAGTLALDEKDRPIGSLTGQLSGHEGLIKGLQDAGQLNQDEANAANTGLGLIAMAAGGKNGELNLPLVLQDGEMFIGPLRIAKLKPLY